MFKRLNNNDRLKELIQEEIKKLKVFDKDSITNIVQDVVTKNATKPQLTDADIIKLSLDIFNELKKEVGKFNLENKKKIQELEKALGKVDALQNTANAAAIANAKKLEANAAAILNVETSVTNAELKQHIIRKY